LLARPDQERHKNGANRGYIAMLAVRDDARGAGLGKRLVRAAVRAMAEQRCDEVVLEAEVTNAAALRLYEQLGFIRDKRLERYYLNGVDAYRLKLRLREWQ
jgi:N-alpha-acetyltransferase 30